MCADDSLVIPDWNVKGPLQTRRENAMQLTTKLRLANSTSRPTKNGWAGGFWNDLEYKHQSKCLKDRNEQLSYNLEGPAHFFCLRILHPNLTTNTVPQSIPPNVFRHLGLIAQVTRCTGDNNLNFLSTREGDPELSLCPDIVLNQVALLCRDGRVCCGWSVNDIKRFAPNMGVHWVSPS